MAINTINSAKYFFLTFLFITIQLQSNYASAQEWSYTTRPGDNLWKISQKYLSSVSYWPQLQKRNSIGVASQLAPGTKLQIPIAWLKLVPAPATIISKSGTVLYKASKSTDVRQISTGEIISIGDIVTTQEGSTTVQFADQSTLLMQRHSEVIFDTLSSYAHTGMVDTRLRLQKGRVETAVKPAKGPASRYQITTPAAVAAVRGTQFRVGFQADTSLMANEVTDGNVSVAGSGVEQAIPAGFGTVTEVGKPPQAPKKLLPAPDLSKLPKIIRRLPFLFEWPAVTGAKSYRVQLSPVIDNTVLTLDSIIDLPQLNVAKLSNEKYIVRIRGIDEITLEGFNASHTFQVDTDFPVPIINNPPQSKFFNNKKMSFSWKKLANIQRYHLQISTQADFKDTIHENFVNGTHTVIEKTLIPNQYYWRISAVSEDGSEGQYSQAGQFTIVPLPQPPKVTVKILDESKKDQQLSFKWNVSEHAKQYELQIASDLDFTNIVTDKTTSATELSIATPATPGIYYYRIRSTASDSAKGIYSEPKQITITEEPVPAWLLWLLVLPFLL